MSNTTAPAPSHLSLPIQGMTCAACAGRVARALAKVPGVAGAHVNLATERAEVEGDAPLEALTAAVEAAGYGLAQRSASLAIGGMTCASCVGRVARALLAVPGVLDAQVNLATETATVRALASVTDAALAQAISRAGYTLRETGGDAAAQESQAARQERWLLLALALLSAPFLAGMAGMALGADWNLPGWAQFALASVVQFGFGWRFYRTAWGALRAGTGNMDLLVALGTTAAWALSTWLLLRHGEGHHLYFESAAVIILFIRAGKYLEARARRATGAAIRALLDLAPRTARRLREDGREDVVPAAALAVGDVVVIRPGERIPADAQVLEGEAGVDESALTGESRAVEKVPGAALHTGGIVLDGRLVARATAVGDDTSLARVAALVAAAQASRAPVQKLVDRISAVFVPVVVGIALLTLAGWLLAGAGAEHAVLTAVAVLVIACPCALGLATPAAIMAGTGAAARAGILLRDAEAIERAQRVTLVAFDKTGTLTEGRPRLIATHVADGVSEAEALALAARLQEGSEHPLARAVLDASAPAPGALEGFRALPGRGVAGQVGGRALLLGSPRALAESGADASTLADAARDEAAAGRTLAWLVETGATPRALALLAFEDTLRPGAVLAVATLQRRLGLSVALLSGDARAAAERVAAQLGIRDVAAEVLPEGKAAQVSLWQRNGAQVAMVGDGVNDAPALAAADLGIAVGSGTDAAIAAAAVTLLRPDPRLVPAALDVTRRTFGKIRQNLAWAFGFNIIGVPLAAFGQLSPLLAGAAMALSSTTVLLNALLLARWQVRETEP